MFRSIKWRLQAWHALILLSVLVGFGVIAVRLERASEFRHVDRELEQRLNVLLATLRNGGPPGHHPGHQRGFPPEPRPPLPNGPPQDDFDRPTAELRRPRAPGDFPPPPGFRLPPQFAGLFGGEGQAPFYYVVWRRDGQQLDRSTNGPSEIAMPERSSVFSALQTTRTRTRLREAFCFTPPGECLMVGRSIAPELGALRRFAFWMTALGASVLVVGLAGGWWVTTRAIRPIRDVSLAAAKIATGDLSHRITTTDTDNELGRMVAVLNSTFSRLEAAFAQQTRFTADASHELRTPVTVILSQTQTVLGRERTAAEYRGSLEACQRAAQRMHRLIESLLELARLDAGLEKMKCGAFNLDQTIADCVELVRPLAAERRLTLRTELTVTECLGDSDRLSQVIMNLLGNAIHYNKEGGDIHLVSRADYTTIILTVSDTGLGISSEHIDHIFERFYRGDSARTSSHGRTGLGLAICRSIVEAHGGTIEVASQAGIGTTFTVRLPQQTVPPSRPTSA
jgi:two-component system, OmpR family, sensor kinase